MLSKSYEPQQYEDAIYKRWEESSFFAPEANPPWMNNPNDLKRPYFSIVLPPPNVTGTLHLGHAVMLAIQDLMIRYHRMKGDRTLWVPGTDHAAIATQTKVEKILIESGMKDPKKELGREEFLARVDRYAKESHDRIITQTKKMGSSLDWSREAFTLDEKRSLAVRTVFKKMYDDGLIYRGYRIVNWCPRCHSTLADDEVEYKEQKAKIYTFKYAKDFPIAIATTRPETKLGDTAVAVNPRDFRYKEYVGKVFDVKNFAGGPNLNIKIIADKSIDSDFGTGAVGVTPAHSHIDYDLYLKHNLSLKKIIDEAGKMSAEAGKIYAGLSVLEARKKVLEFLSAEGLIEKEEEVDNNLSVCYRCKTAIEPIPSKQWFIDVSKKIKIQSKKLKNIKYNGEYSLKELMKKAVESGQIEIIPERFTKTYFHWIDDLRDWCISRQIWYGHQIPVWYKNDEIYVGAEAPKGEGWEQDTDTLDTWFSSGLWTFSTLGYPVSVPQSGTSPGKPSDLETFHPTSVMETGYDILFFWVARMILMTTYTLGEIPFRKVYLHGLIRDEQGRKMSKSLGNVIDPLDVCEKYGTDAVRLSLLLGNTPGNDIRLSEEKIAGFRNFANKLWNIARFIITNSKLKTQNSKLQLKTEKYTLADKWILARLEQVVKEVTEAIEKFNFSYAGEVLRDFTWGELADWYLEIAKIEGDKSEILNYILNIILKLWHPFMPFVTEQIWSEIYGKDKILMVEQWPGSAPMSIGAALGKPQLQFDLIKSIITSIRSLRADYKIEPAKKLKALISAGKYAKLFRDNKAVLMGLARLESLEIKRLAKKPSSSVGFIESGVEMFIDLAGIVDFEKEKARLQKETEELGKYIKNLEKKLDNKEFVKNAPPAIVASEKEKLAEAKLKSVKLEEQVSNLK